MLFFFFFLLKVLLMLARTLFIYMSMHTGEFLAINSGQPEYYMYPLSAHIKMDNEICI
jgi:hypothetical protein